MEILEVPKIEGGTLADNQQSCNYSTAESYLDSL